MTVDEITMSIGDAKIKVKDWTFRWREHTGINSPKKNVPLDVAGAEFKNSYKRALAGILEGIETEDDPLFLRGHDKEKEQEFYARTRASLDRESAQIRQGLAHLETDGMSMSKLTLQGKKDVLLEFVERNGSYIMSYEIIPSPISLRYQNRQFGGEKVSKTDRFQGMVAPQLNLEYDET